jgi:hypothetical protein
MISGYDAHPLASFLEEYLIVSYQSKCILHVNFSFTQSGRISESEADRGDQRVMNWSRSFGGPEANARSSHGSFLVSEGWSLFENRTCLPDSRAWNSKVWFKEQGVEIRIETLTEGEEEAPLYKATSQSDSIAGINDAIVKMHHPAKKVVEM